MTKQEIKNLLLQYIKDTDHIFTTLDVYSRKLQAIKQVDPTIVEELLTDITKMKVIINTIFPKVNLMSRTLKEEHTMNIQMAPLVNEKLVSEKHLGFKKLVKQLKAKGIKEEEIPDEIKLSEDANALAYWIGVRKYGKEGMTKKAAAGRKKAAKK
jgi:hypothetical protein